MRKSILSLALAAGMSLTGVNEGYARSNPDHVVKSDADNTREEIKDYVRNHGSKNANDRFFVSATCDKKYIGVIFLKNSGKDIKTTLYNINKRGDGYEVMSNNLEYVNNFLENIRKSINAGDVRDVICVVKTEHFMNKYNLLLKKLKDSTNKKRKNLQKTLEELESMKNN